ncbi:MAG: DbpA RNA binding domain-containing protein, partial [Pseudomonadota bacterium]|nr:DbpA RNA binding domain-containing protein [Pseudomonadota bacterium]
GTPGRVIDHLERGSLDLSELKCLVLDEADEMLRMGFIDDVETVLKKTPESRQVVLFSATMPTQIRRIAQTYLKNPQEVTITAKTTTAANIRQRYWSVSGLHKLDALTRILEAEPFDAMLVFARTKSGTDELAGKLQARGLRAASINGDVQQAQRERTIQQLKEGTIDVLVATDVAARGLDVDRISHVLNYDIPYDTESYVHRIGRTGRAGRSGEAILFVTPREKGMLRAIERATRQPIEQMELPSVEAVNDKRVDKFLGRISDALSGGETSPTEFGMYRDLVMRYERERNVPLVEIAAALAKLLQGKTPLLLAPERKAEFVSEGREPRGFSERPARAERAPRGDKPERSERMPRKDIGPRGAPEPGMETYRIEVGHVHGVKPGNIVGAIANEADLESRFIGRIDIHDDHSVLDLPEGMPPELLSHLKKVRVAGQQLQLSKAGDMADSGRPAFRPKTFAPKSPSKPHRKGSNADKPRTFRPKAPR